MNRLSMLARRLVLSLGLSVSLQGSFQGAFAHDKWFDVEPFFSEQTTRAKVYLQTGEALQQPEPLPVRLKSKVTRFELASIRGRRDLMPSLHEDEQPIASIGPLVLGTYAMRLDTAPVLHDMDAGKFQSYLLEERLIDILVQRQQRGEEDAPGRERYSRCIKAIMQVGGRRDDFATQPIGQDLEIVPLTHPYDVRPGQQLSVQVLYKARSLEGHAVSAAYRYRDRVREVWRRTDAQGIARFPIEQPGEWLIRLVHMERSTEPDADWRSYWSSLSFRVAEASPGAPAAPAARTDAPDVPAMPAK